ncbi:hypothetical protein [Brucella intermedia]|uniref:hypothetical protein n=1 Tax=Brucella intermedia TaxID=94625 RepID=UPI00235F5953|nr:hypothetical protein [Brucella intermedia]
MNGIIEKNVQMKALVQHSKGASGKELRGITELAIKNAYASLQKHIPELAGPSPRPAFTEEPQRKPANNTGVPTLPPEMWTEIVQHLKAVDPAATKTLRLVNKQLKDIAERDVKKLVVKNNDGFQSLKKTGSYKRAEKLILIGNEGEFRNIPPRLKGKLVYLERPRDDMISFEALRSVGAFEALQGGWRQGLAWNYFNRLKKSTEGTTFSLLDAAKAAGIKVSHPPQRNGLSAWVRGLFAHPARAEMEHFMKAGFTAVEAAEFTNVENEKLVSELGGRRLDRFPAQRDRRHIARIVPRLQDLVRDSNVTDAMGWLNEQDRRQSWQQ